MALRHRPDRVSENIKNIIAATIPNRLNYFDNQNFDLYPVVPVPEPATPLLIGLAAGVTVLLRRVRRVTLRSP